MFLDSKTADVEVAGALHPAGWVARRASEAAAMGPAGPRALAALPAAPPAVPRPSSRRQAPAATTPITGHTTGRTTGPRATGIWRSRRPISRAFRLIIRDPGDLQVIAYVFM